MGPLKFFCIFSVFELRIFALYQHPNTLLTPPPLMKSLPASSHSLILLCSPLSPLEWVEGCNWPSLLRWKQTSCLGTQNRLSVCLRHCRVKRTCRFRTHTHTHRALFNHPPSPNNYYGYLGKVILCSLVFQSTQLSGLRRNRDAKFACWSSTMLDSILDRLRKVLLLLAFLTKSLELQLKISCCIMQTLCMRRQSASMLTPSCSRLCAIILKNNDIKSATGWKGAVWPAETTETSLELQLLFKLNDTEEGITHALKATSNNFYCPIRSRVHSVSQSACLVRLKKNAIYCFAWNRDVMISKF